MFEKILNQNQNKKEEQPRILLPEELKKIIEPKKEEGIESIKTHGEQKFLQDELGAKRVLMKQMKDKGLSIAGLERDIEIIERKLGAGHA